ncbi:energy transducer TonB [Flavobacterium sp.]|uniref:energy transducer TonB n=1 Tax=Flavobacterium sp. TaxID=239 RepID=UPI00404851F7
MKLLETSEEKKSFVISSVILLVILLICIFFGLTSLNPPPENGIAINFGTSDVGQGEIQPTEPVQSAPQNSQSQPETTQDEDILTDDNESPVVVQPKKTPTKPEKPTETKPVTKPTPKTSQQTNSALNSILNGKPSEGSAQGGHGDDGLAGDKGDPNGSIYANSFYGNGTGNGTGSGSGSGYGLGGRRLSSPGKKVEQCGNESGRVVVQITVNKNGSVIKTQYSKGTTNTTPCVLEAAYKTARAYKWQPDSNAPDTQIGFVVVNFNVGE